VAILIRDGWRSWHSEILGGLIPTEFGDATHSICLAMARFKSHPKFLDCAFSLVDLPKGVAYYNNDGNFTRRTLHRKRTGRRPQSDEAERRAHLPVSLNRGIAMQRCETATPVPNAVRGSLLRHADRATERVTHCCFSSAEPAAGQAKRRCARISFLICVINLDRRVRCQTIVILTQCAMMGTQKPRRQ
jgi:hypothetical protein